MILVACFVNDFGGCFFELLCLKVGKAAEEMWKSMSEEEKSPYEVKSGQRKVEYEKQMKAYNKKQVNEVQEKRRLEKALATSAAIRSELEQKKQKKKEEQQRLDEESAAIVEAVALHVLVGEDSDDSCMVMLNKEEGFNPWDYANNLNLFMGGGRGRGCFLQQGQANWGGNWSLPYGAYGGDLQASYSYLEDGSWGNTGVSADLIAAQAVSALQITEDAAVDTIVLKGFYCVEPILYVMQRPRARTLQAVQFSSLTMESSKSGNWSKEVKHEDDSDVLIECRNVYKSFGEKHILRGVSFKRYLGDYMRVISSY
ncbi:hypothetical protein CXB51_016428 [Gossypium anomalum]|uniref:HMG box domain-containing protein n=1 Tax=Gossypium anomalum TaxID=47600 RepID=A0A8J5YR25_9ROSI|nr:hypothetical protein CXB51_016428 [Gossypium anomalum]